MRAALLGWYRRHRRALPWRETRDPYAIWVSEAMLQQTRVETVLRYWPKFLRRFPTVEHLARARTDSVLAQWSGLGYYSRARNLQRAARIVVERFAGRLPADVESLRTLPGVGRYTAGAVASIAFGARAPVVDGNVARVLSRLFAIPGDPRSSAMQRRLWNEAAALVPTRAPGDWNQALMELGARVCTPRSPDCPRCPVHRSCSAHRSGDVESFPQTGPRAPVVSERRRVVFAERDGRVLLLRRHEGQLLRGLWEFPGVEEARALGLRLRVGRRPTRAIRHSILDRRIETVVVPAQVLEEPVPRHRHLRWVPLERLESLPLSASALKIARAALPAPRSVGALHPGAQRSVHGQGRVRA